MDFFVENEARSQYYAIIEGVQMRFYKFEDNYLPSVTNILSNTKNMDAIDKWKKRVGEEEAKRILDFSNRRGTYFHDWIEILMKNKKHELSDLLELVPRKELLNKKYKDELLVAGGMIKNLLKNNMTDGFTKTQHSFRFHEMIDEVLYCEKMVGHYWEGIGGYAGSFDMLAKHKDGDNILIDFKTARKPKETNWIPDYFNQLSAYWNAIENYMKIDVSRACIVMANDSNGLIQYWEIDEEYKNDKLWFFKDRVEKFYKMYEIDI